MSFEKSPCKPQRVRPVATQAQGEHNETQLMLTVAKSRRCWEVTKVISPSSPCNEVVGQSQAGQVSGYC